MFRLAGKYKYVDADLINVAKYDTHFGIFNHDLDDRPLSLIAAHLNEDPTYGSMWDTYVEHYSTHDMWEQYHVTLLDIMDLPRWKVDDLLLKSIEKANRKQKPPKLS